MRAFTVNGFGGALAALAMGVLALTGPACAQAPAAPAFATSGDPGFDAWRADFAARAIAGGRNPSIVQQLLSNITPAPDIVTLDRNQAEFVSPPWVYMNGALSPARINAGMTKKAETLELFAQVQARYGVDADIIAGIWGIETNFGAARLNYDAAAALATLAYDTRRRARFEQYLLALIEMVERGYAGPNELKSSWAGALGQPQFMPDMYLSTAADWDGDGRRDIWNNTGDILASIGNYLAKHGWKPNGPVFFEVQLPPGFDYALADNTPRTLTDWAQRNVRRIDGAQWEPFLAEERAELFLPAGWQGPALLLFDNFNVIKTYNNSDRYALAVALMARAFEGRGLLAQPWPTHLGAIRRDDMMALQQSLTRLGYTAGNADGMFGDNTRRAVRAFQVSQNLPADGYPTPELLDKVRAIDPQAPPRSDPVADLERERARSAALGAAGIRQLQRALNSLGYKLGAPDGVAGPKTRAAISAEERRLGLKASGRPTSFILDRVRRRL